MRIEDNDIEDVIMGRRLSLVCVEIFSLARDPYRPTLIVNIANFFPEHPLIFYKTATVSAIARDTENGCIYELHIFGFTPWQAFFWPV